MKNLINRYKKILVITLLAVFVVTQCSSVVLASDTPLPPLDIPRDADPLQQMNRMKNLMEQQLLEEDLQKGLQEYDQKAVDDDDVEKARKSTGSDLKFKIKDVQYTESTTLTKDELNKLSEPYIGQEVTLDQLYKLVDEVNELYRKKGYAVCRAFLPEQTIKDGIAKVTLVEGKTGKVKLDKVRFTRKSYILSRTGLTHGKVNNLKELNRRVSLFNATNDAQLAVKLAAGEEQGTTDYVLTLDEPDRHTVYAMADNTGSDSTGLYRFSLGWTINSLLGIRDTLSLSYAKTSGSNSGGASYSFPITKVGTRVALSVYGNAMDMTGFEPGFQRLEPHGDSVSYSVNVSQPFCITPQLRIVGDFSWSEQSSDSKFQNYEAADVQWKDDTTTKYTGGIAFTHFGRGIVWYHRHSITRANWESKFSGNGASTYWLYNLNFVRQQAFMNGNSLTVKLNAQYAPSAISRERQSAERDNNLNTSDYFYIGGVGSVRGYKESLLGGEHGFSLNLEYAMPFRNYRNLTPIFFLDYGRVFGPDSFDDNQLASTGLGLRWYNKDGKLSATVWLGIPLIKDANAEKVDGARIHFSLYGQFEDLLASLFKRKKTAKKEGTLDAASPTRQEQPVEEKQSTSESAQPAEEAQPAEVTP